MPTSPSGGVRRVVTGAGVGGVAVAPTTAHNAGGSGGLGSGVVVDAILLVFSSVEAIRRRIGEKTCGDERHFVVCVMKKIQDEGAKIILLPAMKSKLMAL